jgi:hypothetical protein
VRRLRAALEDEDTQAEEDIRENRSQRQRNNPNPNVDGGKYGLGSRVDDALDRTTDERTFLVGALAFTLGAVALFLFGPRPPTEY